MTTMPTRIAALALLAFAGQAMAQPASESPPPPAGSEPAPSLDPKRNNAAKIAGLVGFVNLSCPDAKADPERFKAVVTRLGVDPADLEGGELHLRAMAYIEAYQKDVPASCARALAGFGENGTTIPGLLVRR